MSALRTARATARHGAVSALAGSWHAAGRVERAVRRPRVHLPYLHTVTPAEEPAFRALLAWLARDHTFVSYSEAVRRAQEGEIDRPYVAFSFDDGFASNVRTAAILEEHGARGMFFVTTGFIGTPTVAEAREVFGYSAGIDEAAMTWADLEGLLARGHEVGNHTATHRQVSTLSAQEMADQIGTAAATLEQRLGGAPHFAWPFGRFGHFTAAAADEVYRLGHLTCASAERGAHVEAGGMRVCLRRDHLMTSWPLRHQQYFLARSAERAGAADNRWPDGWEVRGA